MQIMPYVAESIAQELALSGVEIAPSLTLPQHKNWNLLPFPFDSDFNRCRIA